MNHLFEHNLTTRKIFLSLIDQLTVDELNLIPEGFRNNIIWNIVHSITAQQGLVYGLSGLEKSVTKELADKYGNGTMPDGEVSKEQIEEYKVMLLDLIEKTKTDYESGVFKEFKEYTTGTGYKMRNVEEALSMNNIHEGIHLGYALAIRKAIKNN
ncbi:MULTISPECIES: DinB family protein [unclassified Nonlabens]|uniref:DinB family protein n=1 Tax=unclassified Nonlabens TaxID=2615035 RepID=UPI00386F365F